MENIKIVQLEERVAEVEGKLVEVRNTNDFGVLGHVILNTPTEIRVLKEEIKGLEYKYEGNLEQKVSQSTFHPAIMGNEVAEYTVFNGTARKFIELHERKLSLLELILDIAKERKEAMDNSIKEESVVVESVVETKNNDYLESEMREQEQKDSELATMFRNNGWCQVNGVSNVEFMYDRFVTSMEKNGYWIDIRRIPTEKELNMRDMNVGNKDGLDGECIEDVMDSIFS